MFCVADTPVAVTVVTALPTTRPGYAAAPRAVVRAEVTAAPLLDSTLANAVRLTYVPKATVGLAEGLLVGGSIPA